MGLTFTTLNVYGAERAAVEALLTDTDQIRDQNAPWLTVVPAEGGAPKRLEKAAKKLTKECASALALLFFYFDDDMFLCALYQGGKKSASFENGQSWLRLGKALGERLGDDGMPKAFRYASKCSGMEEQIALLEETVGTAFYELQEEKPRVVKKGDAALRAVKAREALLKKRPNRYELTELDEEAWPEELRSRQKLYDALRPQWQRYHLTSLMVQTDMGRYLVPGSDLVFYPYLSDFNTKQGALLMLDGKTGDCRVIGPFPEGIDRAVWMTKRGDIVMHLICWRPTVQELSQGLPPKPIGLLCVDREGNERWRFQPELAEFQATEIVHVSEQGVITLFAPGYNGQKKADSVVCRVDGETGQLLCTRTFPYQENAHHMIHVDALNAFLYCRRTTKELVLLDEAFNETRAFGGFTGYYYFTKNQLCGSALWEGNAANQRSVTFWDLNSGASRRTQLEVPAYVLSVLEDGRILGTNEKQSALTVFDREGRVAARCAVPGTLGRALSQDGAVYLTEVRGPDTHGFVYDALFDQTSLHVWRLSAVSAD